MSGGAAVQVDAELADLYTNRDDAAVDLGHDRQRRRAARIQRATVIVERLEACPALVPPGGPQWEVERIGDGDDDDGAAATALPRQPSVDWALPGLDPASESTLSPHDARRKREQLASMLGLLRAHVLPRLKLRGGGAALSFVDFACGAGHLGLLIACAVPGSRVTLVDVQEAALDTARRRIASIGPDVASRVTTRCCKISEFEQSFDCAVCLHGCGPLVDEVVSQAVRHSAAFCVVPCCYGELLAPRSAAFRSQGHWLDAEAFVQLARTAEHPGGETSGVDACVEYVVDGPLPRRAMRMLDCDRALALSEAGLGYVTRLARLSPLACSPKHDVLLGWHGDGSEVATDAQFTGGSGERDDDRTLIDGLPWLG